MLLSWDRRSHIGWGAKHGTIARSDTEPLEAGHGGGALGREGPLRTVRRHNHIVGRPCSCCELGDRWVSDSRVGRRTLDLEVRLAERVVLPTDRHRRRRGGDDGEIGRRAQFAARGTEGVVHVTASRLL